MTDWELYQQLGQELESRELYSAALDCYSKGTGAESHAAVAGVLVKMGRVEEAANYFRRALRQSPRQAECPAERRAEFHRRLARCWVRLGDARKAAREYRQALQNDPSDDESRTGLLVTLHYGPHLDPPTLYAEHLEWARRQPEPDGAAVRALPRVGYVSPHLHGGHSVCYFISHIIQAHRERPTCYAEQDQPAELSHARWRNITGWSDECLFDQIRRDRIGILVDLSGHFSRNRLPVFARKPAPVQVTWLGYPNTTGLKTMDYRLTDSIADPPGATEHLHTERLVRLDGCFLCYRPLENAPRPGIPPHRRARPFTYGCFNRLIKITPPALELWASILRATPGSRLLLHHGSGAYAEGNSKTRTGILRHFEKHGVTPDRIQMVQWLPSVRDHLKMYHQIDVQLDPFPYSGTTTTCESLWMGVPVITLAGKVHVGRVSASLLRAAGLPDWITTTQEDYRRLAIEWAKNREGLAKLRRTLRQQMAASPLTDTTTFTRRLEQTYQNLWSATSRPVMGA